MDDATVLVNYQSNFDEPKYPYLAILKTFWEANFAAVATMPREERPADIVFIASPNKLPDNIFDDNHMNDCCFNNDIVKFFRKNSSYITKTNVSEEKLNPVPVLVDDKPQLETMNKESIITWRKHMIDQTERVNFGLFK
jgi:hypothetical protein